MEKRNQPVVSLPGQREWTAYVRHIVRVWRAYPYVFMYMWDGD
ncbi:hypothetical protein [Komagataeibacter kakiaceti]|nr:hypothetical protein [Komagataeibacter kakiaceti]